jgi:hypothetical protein
MRAVHRQTPLTVRREYDRTFGTRLFTVRAKTGPSTLEVLGVADTGIKREEILRICRDGGFAVDEVVPENIWICRPKATP